MDRASENNLGRPSRTAVWAAAGRALSARAPEPRWQNPDHLAAKLIGPEEIALMGDHPLAGALDEDVSHLRDNPEVMAAVITMLVRTRFVDEHLEAAIAGGARQVVFLGAGFDTRAYRFQELLKPARVFEVDHPATQQWKRRRAQQALGETPENLRYVAVDFRTDSLAGKLREAGYDPSVKTFFLWEGVTMYLTAEAVDATLGWIAQQAPGSRLVFDFASRALIELTDRINNDPAFEPGSDAERAAAVRARNMERWGEPWIFGIDPDQVAAFLAERGLEHRETLSFASKEAAREVPRLARSVAVSLADPGDVSAG